MTAEQFYHKWMDENWGCRSDVPKFKDWFNICEAYAAAQLAELMGLGKAVLIGGPNYIKRNGHYVMRVFGNPGYVKFACEHQGYCEILNEIPKVQP